MTHEHIVYDSDPHFSIDADTRLLTYTSPEKLTIIQGDHNSEIFTFEVPRYVDGHDMMLCNKVQVHYINIDATQSTKRSTGIYDVSDLQLKDDDENTVVFSWTISKNATAFVGTLNFVLRFACVSGSRVDYVWNTAVYSGVLIYTGIDNSEVVMEQYPDILESWYLELIGAGTMGVNIVVEARDEALAMIGNVGGMVVSETEPQVEEAKAWVDPTSEEYTLLLEANDIANELGDSYEKVASQKLVTEIYQEINDRLRVLFGELEFTLVEGGYEVTGIGSYKLDEVYIPSKHLGLPVVSIGGTFNGYGNVTAVYVPASVKYLKAHYTSEGFVDGGAFAGMSRCKVYDFSKHTTVPEWEFEFGIFGKMYESEIPEDAKILVQTDMFDAFVSSAGWNLIESQIEGV